MYVWMPHSCLLWFFGTGPAMMDVEQAASSRIVEKIAIVKTATN